MYELGIAHALGKPVVPIVQDTNDLPFDLQSYRFIVYQTNSPSWAAGLKRRVTNMLREAVEDPILNRCPKNMSEPSRPV
jgi:nucleoside 2-deoxyribosyltransferase